jgi:hypothetical protein
MFSFGKPQRILNAILRRTEVNAQTASRELKALSTGVVSLKFVT